MFPSLNGPHLSPNLLAAVQRGGQHHYICPCPCTLQVSEHMTGRYDRQVSASHCPYSTGGVADLALPLVPHPQGELAATAVNAPMASAEVLAELQPYNKDVSNPSNARAGRAGGDGGERADGVGGGAGRAAALQQRH